MELLSALAERANAPAPGLAGLPACAVACVTRACALSDLSCICSGGEVEEQRTDCIVDWCIFSQSLIARNITATACNLPIHNRTVEFNVMTLTLLFFTSFSVLFRLIFKQFFSARGRLGADDCFVVLSALVGIPCICILIFGLNMHGLGRDVWTLAPGDVREFARYFYIMEILYLAVITFVRLTFCLFFLEIFPGSRIRRLLWATFAFHASCGLAFIFKVVFQCWPIRHNWDKYSDHPPPGGRCIHINASTWANAGLGVATDLWLLAIPLSQLQKLKLHWKKKLGASLMFLAGAVGTLISILRLHSIVNFAHSNNPTRHQFGIIWWSNIEVQVGIICACLPTVRLILVRMWPRIFGSTIASQRKTGSERTTQRTGQSAADVESTAADEAGTSRICKTSITNVVKTPLTPLTPLTPMSGHSQEKASEEFNVEGWSNANTHRLPIELGERTHEAGTNAS